MKICKNCGKEFQEKNSKAQYCSTSCRVSYFQKEKRKEKIINEPAKIDGISQVVNNMLNGMSKEIKIKVLVKLLNEYV